MEHQAAVKNKQAVAQHEASCCARPTLKRAESFQLFHDLQQWFGNRALGHRIQAKLKVSTPGDVYEQEADRVADQVMRMTDPVGPDVPAHAQITSPKLSSAVTHVARKAAAPKATVEERILDEIKRGPGAGDSKALDAHKERLRELFESVLLFEARPLYQRLHKGKEGDAFAQFFQRLDPEVRQEMLGILMKKYAVPSAPAGSYWEFGLVGNRVMARSTPGATYNDLANGAFGTGKVASMVTIDITSAFPSWVKHALTEQVATGVKLRQASAQESPVVSDTFSYELGWGNCHGFTFQLFKLYRNEPIKKWVINYPYGHKPEQETLTSPPPGVPAVFGEFPTRYQVGNIRDLTKELEMKPEASAHYNRYSAPGGYKWGALLDVGKTTVERKIVAEGATSTATPIFGDLGLWKKKYGDHSVIAFGAVGRYVYVLQKLSPYNPYFINLRPIAEFDWYVMPK